MQLEFFDVPSPCIGICQSDTKGYCLGCFRTREERQHWLSFSNDEKQKVIKRCVQRKRRKENAAKPKEETIAVVNVDNEEHVEQPSLLDPPSSKDLDTSHDLDFDDFEL